MIRFFRKTALILTFLTAFAVAAVPQPGGERVRSQEISEVDGLPVLIKHLPDWENVRPSTVFVTDLAALRQAAGERSVLDRIEFIGGTEAVTALYPAGRLVIIEFPTPQGSVDADTKILAHLATAPEAGTVYRRIGNYNAFVFDSGDANAAAALLDQVKYEKQVQWLGEDPFLLQKFERYFISTSRDIFISIVIWIVGGLGISAVLGVLSGIIVYRLREQKRAQWSRYTDAGGMTRLNLDDLSEQG